MSSYFCERVGALLQSLQWNPLEGSSPDKSELPSLSLPMPPSAKESAESKQHQSEEAEEAEAYFTDDEGEDRMNSNGENLIVDKQDKLKVIGKKNEDLEKNKDAQLVCSEEDSKKMDDYQLACSGEDTEQEENVELTCDKDDREKKEDAEMAYIEEDTKKYANSHVACREEDLEKKGDHMVCNDDMEKKTNAQFASSLEMGEDKNNTLEASPQTKVLDEEDNLLDEGQETLTRPSAMKGGVIKSPPPGSYSKKGVHFADSVGGELVHRYVIPSVSLNEVLTVSPKAVENHYPAPRNRWSPKFNLSFQANLFEERVDQQKVVVESAYADELNKVSGTVCVLNIAYEKQVMVRYTNNNWLTVCEVLAEHSMTSPCGKYDFFSFEISFDNRSVALEFAVFYAVGSDIFWDNNFGQNYCFDPFYDSYL